MANFNINFEEIYIRCNLCEKSYFGRIVYDECGSISIDISIDLKTSGNTEPENQVGTSNTKPFNCKTNSVL